MAKNVFTGNDTMIIDGEPLTDGASGTIVEVTFPNDKAAMNIGKNGNTIYQPLQEGKKVNVTIRVLIGNSDDMRLNARNSGQDNDFPSFQVLTANFSKTVGDGNGKLSHIKYILDGGVFLRDVDGREDTTDNTEQAIATYNLQFSSGQRIIS